MTDRPRDLRTGRWRATRTAARPGPGPIADRLVRQLELTLDRRVGGQMSGDHLGRGRGTGLELDRIRPYEPGDDVRQIDWNATARTLVPQVREDVPDRQLTAWLLLDHSPSMHFGTADRRKADVAEGAALVVGRFAARRGNRLGIVTFGAGRGGRHAADRRQPRDARPAPRHRHRAARGGRRRDVAGPRPGARRRHRTTPGVVVIVSDFRGPRDWVRALTEVAGRHAVIALEVIDPREDALVDVGELTLIDPETGRTLRVDTGDRRLRTAFDDAAAADRMALAGEFRRLGRPPPPTLHRRPVAPRARPGFTRTPDRTGRPA